MCRVTFEFDGDRDYSKKHLTKSKFPTWCCIEFTKTCNFNCMYCFAGEKKAGSNELTTEEYKHYFEQLKELGFKQVSLLGGEPTLREDLFDVAKFAIDLGLVVHICSNASTITKKFAEKIKMAGITQVQTNMDHILPEKHDAIRGFNGSYALLIKALKNLRNEEVPVVLATIAMKTNKDVIPQIFEFARKNASAYRVWDMMPCGRGAKNCEQILSAKEYRDVMLQLIKLAKEHNVPLIRTADPIIRLLDPEIMRGSCPAAKKMCYLDVEGNISPCSMGAEFCGNIRSKALKDILSSDAFSERILNNKCAIDTCSFMKECNGGCYLRQVNGVDQKCWIR